MIRGHRIKITLDPLIYKVCWGYHKKHKKKIFARTVSEITSFGTKHGMSAEDRQLYINVYEEYHKS